MPYDYKRCLKNVLLVNYATVHMFVCLLFHSHKPNDLPAADKQVEGQRKNKTGFHYEAITHRSPAASQVLMWVFISNRLRRKRERRDPDVLQLNTMCVYRMKRGLNMNPNTNQRRNLIR